MDRAAVVTTAILQIIRQDPANARAAIQTLLREEFAAIAQQTRNEIRREDG
jgi:hypothetical protein